MASDGANTGPVSAGPTTVAKSPPTQIIVQQPPSMFGRFGKWLVTALVLAVVIIFSLIGSYRSYFGLADLPNERYHSLAKNASKKIAIINVQGLITEGDGFVKKQIDRVKQDPDVVGVVLRVDSPGGTVTGSDYIYHHLRKLAEDRKLPLVVSMGGICASGGYYISMAVGDEPDAIFAEPMTWTGSIGVIIPHYDFSGLLGKYSRGRRFGRQRAAQADGKPHEADEAGGAEAAATVGRRHVCGLQADRQRGAAEV